MKLARFLKKCTTGCMISMIVLNFTACGAAVDTKDTQKTSTISEQNTPKQNNIEELRPQDDFYGYINRDTLRSLNLHYGDSYGGPAADIMEQTDREVYELISILGSAKEDAEPGSAAQLVKDAYLQYVNGEEEADLEAKKEFDKWAADILAAKDKPALMKLMEQFVKEQGIIAYFDVAVERNYYKSSEYAIYIEQKTGISGVVSLEDIYNGDEARENLKMLAQEILVSCGISPKEADEKAKDYVYLVLEIARNTDYEITHAPNPYITFQYQSDEQLQNLLGDIKLEEFQQMYGIGANPYEGIYVQDEGQLQKLAELFDEANLDELKTYLLCELVLKNYEFLLQDMDFLKAYVPQTYDARDITGAIYVNNLLPDCVSELYASKYYTEEMDALITKMHDDIVKGYHELIDGADWLSGETRAGLSRKLDNMIFVKGGGNTQNENADLRAEECSLIGSNAYETQKNVRVKEYQNQLSRIGKIHEKGEIDMPSQVVNSVYSIDNIFCITAAIMHAPYFDVDADYAVNMGGLGMVIAHEMGHAFDSNCINYDADGNYNPDWISKEDREKLEERMQAMIEYYSNFTVMDVYHVDGALTCGENYADKGGMECLMKVVTEPRQQKKLFDNYAKIWCVMKEDTMAIADLTANEHSPESVRVNAVLASTDEFYDVYNVTPQDNMYVNPKERVFRWR